MGLLKGFYTFIRMLDYVQEVWRNPEVREDFSYTEKVLSDTVEAHGYEFMGLTKNFILSFREKGQKSYYQITSSENELKITLKQ